MSHDAPISIIFKQTKSVSLLFKIFGVKTFVKHSEYIDRIIEGSK